MSIPFADIRARVSLSEIVGRYVELTQRGAEYQALCPFHNETTPSFTVFTGRDGVQKFQCFGCGVHGDAVDFVAAMHKESLDQAVARIENCQLPESTARPEPIVKPVDDSADWLPILPAPADAPPYGPRFTYNPKRAKNVSYEGAERVSTYRDQDGRILFHVARLVIDGKKLPITVCYCRHKSDGRSKWVAIRPARPYPLYGLDLLAARPAAPVMVFEGEKKRDLAEPHLEAYVCVSIYGGTGSGPYADLTPLAGRTVVWWPDADAGGVAMMRSLAGRAGARENRFVSVDAQPEGWDAGDLAESGGSFDEYLSTRIVGAITAPQPAAPQAIPPAETPPRPAAPVVKLDTRRKLPVDPDPEIGIPPEYSEDHLAELFVDKYHEHLCFVAEAEEWRVWLDGRWQRDRTLLVRDTIRIKVCRAAGMAAMSRSDLGAKGATIAGKLGSARTIGAIDALARSDRRVAKMLDDFDADHDIINTPAGVVDLRTGDVRKAVAGDYLSRITRATPKGECPEWLQFIDQATAGDTELAEFLQRWAGLCMTGDTSEQKFVFFYGPGGSGKGTFITMLMHCLGDYAMTTAMDTFTKKSRDSDSGIPTDLASLKHARLVTAQETEEGKRWNEQRIKMSTGEDTISARFMRQDFFEYRPRFKLLFAGNHRPQLDNVGVDITRRLLIVPFTNGVPIEKQDMRLKERLMSEADGIMNWMLQGCLQWRKIGLKAPESVRVATAEYFEDQDIPTQFVAECCDLSDKSVRIRATTLYARYAEWCESIGHPPRNRQRFLDSMEVMGVRRLRGRIEEHGSIRSGVALVAGCRLLPPGMAPGGDAVTFT